MKFFFFLFFRERKQSTVRLPLLSISQLKSTSIRVSIFVTTRVFLCKLHSMRLYIDDLIRDLERVGENTFIK